MVVVFSGNDNFWTKNVLVLGMRERSSNSNSMENRALQIPKLQKMLILMQFH